MRLRLLGVGALALSLGFALVLLRGEPTVAEDQGVFLSVAARLLDGDRLYVDVVDNKDPLFFFTYAAALGAAGWRGPFLLDAVWLALGAVSIALLVRDLRAPRAAVVASFVIYPLALTASWYLPGASMLGALAITPLVPWLWLRGRFASSGAVLALVMLFKINLVPVPVAQVGALALLAFPESPRWRDAGRATLGLGGTLVAAAAILGLRGELRAYLDTVAYNVHYAAALDGSSTVKGPVHHHLRVVLDFFHDAGWWQLPVTLAILAAFAASSVFAWRRADRAGALAGIAAAGLLSSGVVLALTAYWEHHLQVLAYVATLVAATLISVSAGLRRRAGVVLASAFVIFALSASLKHVDGLGVADRWTTRPASGGAVALERARARFAPRADRVSYMVLGSNHERGHAAFIGHQFHLACRWFQLYPFSLPAQFDETLDCAERERPVFVLVTTGFFEPDRGHAWDDFVARARKLLRTRYRLVEREPTGFQVWRLT